jgi:predicted DNA-binding transcriptional regulator AlpA
MHLNAEWQASTKSLTATANFGLERTNYMSVQDQQHGGAAVPRNAASVPERSPSGNVESSQCSEPLLGMEDAAKYLGMSTKWMYRNYKTLAHILIGSGPKPRIKFRRCDLDAWVRRHRIQ